MKSALICSVLLLGTITIATPIAKPGSDWKREAQPPGWKRDPIPTPPDWKEKRDLLATPLDWKEKHGEFGIRDSKDWVYLPLALRLSY
ncbi:hypothetical protein AA313_de0204527 [Arthrobotrys entomopaga]|nr:hypothetical protein AA313_de0204527 [Arthrobotrys entomopaga]